MKNCDIGGCIDRGHETCPKCKHWTPSRTHKYFSCQKYQASREECELPRTSCPTCIYFIPPTGVTGKINETGVDWKDPIERKKYYRDKQRLRRGTVIKLTIHGFMPNDPGKHGQTEQK